MSVKIIANNIVNMNILSLLKRFVPPYRWQVAANLFFNVLSTILSLFSFATIIPVLQILFGLSQIEAVYIPLSDATTMQETINLLKNNLYYFMQTQIEAQGAQIVLLLLGGCLVLLTGLKCLTAWLANYYMVPIRTGVLRDLREQLYKKVVSLPIG